MSDRLIEVVADHAHMPTVTAAAEHYGAVAFWCTPATDDGRQTCRILVHAAQQQRLLDTVQSILSSASAWQVVILPVEAALPRDDTANGAAAMAGPGTVSREEIYADVEKGARGDTTYALLVTLSTVVAAIGLMEDNVAVLIGAMVIAPLLGPNLAFSLATALGDRHLMGRALLTNGLGIAISLGVSVAIGFLLPIDLESRELLSRTDVGFDGMALALASGAAAVLSLTTGLSSALVGVMVAVALLPPTAALGLMLAAGRMSEALGALLLLAVNVVCLNLAAQAVFLVKRMRPRTWLEREAARQSFVVNFVMWVVLLGILIGVILFRRLGL